MSVSIVDTNKNRRIEGEGEGLKKTNKEGKKVEIDTKNKNKRKKTILKTKKGKTIRIASINLRKRIDMKIIQLKEVIEKNEIDIVLTQEWGGWAHEKGKYENSIKGYYNFCSFKTKKGVKQTNKSRLVMGKKEERRATIKLNEGRKKGTTILVRKDLINQFNVDEIKLKKDGEIQVIEMVIKKKKIVIMNMHAEPSRIETKKEIFFQKIKKVMENIEKDTRILLGGDANSIWRDTDTTTKTGGNKTIKQFCKKEGMVDLMWKKRKEKMGKKEAEKEEFHTWEKEQQNLTKRLDSF
jgi:exonuclease III